MDDFRKGAHEVDLLLCFSQIASIAVTSIGSSRHSIGGNHHSRLLVSGSALYHLVADYVSVGCFFQFASIVMSIGGNHSCLLVSGAG